MGKCRVVITGVGAVSPFGWGVEPMLKGLANNQCALSSMVEKDAVGGMTTSVAGKVPLLEANFIPREYRRSMSQMSIMAFVASSEALRVAQIEPSLPLDAKFASMGVSVSSTISSPNTLEDFFGAFTKSRSVETVRSTTFFKVMSHAVASNLVVCFGLNGRCYSPVAACASGLQAVGLGFEAIANGKAKLMLCGGSEEFHPLLPATFDRIGAASQCNDPNQASRPFDLQRSGVVCSEGAGILLLEEYEHAKQRSAPILAEIKGFGANSSPSSIVSPEPVSIENCMRQALSEAELEPKDICMINAHGTATEQGDIAEGQAITRIFGNIPFVNSLKGHLGHTMAASGALELIAAMLAAKDELVNGTLNLTQIDPRCGNLNLHAEGRHAAVRYLLKNSFGLGGINASLILKTF